MLEFKDGDDLTRRSVKSQRLSGFSRARIWIRLIVSFIGGYILLNCALPFIAHDIDLRDRLGFACEGLANVDTLVSPRRCARIVPPDSSF